MELVSRYTKARCGDLVLLAAIAHDRAQVRVDTEITKQERLTGRRQPRGDQHQVPTDPSEFVQERKGQADTVDPRADMVVAATAKERFTVDTLQKVHAAKYGKNLVDIISMVKHAADREAPLLTADERVSRALARVTAGKTFSPEEQRWLGHITAHLREELVPLPEGASYLGFAFARGETPAEVEAALREAGGRIEAVVMPRLPVSAAAPPIQ